MSRILLISKPEGGDQGFQEFNRLVTIATGGRSCQDLLWRGAELHPYNGSSFWKDGEYILEHDGGKRIHQLHISAIRLLYEDDAAPDAFNTFAARVLELTGHSCEDFKRNVLLYTPDELTLLWRLDDYLLEYNGDDPFHKLHKIEPE